MDHAVKELQSIIDKEPPYKAMQKAISSFGILALVAYVFTFFMPFIGMILGSFLMIVPMLYTNELIDFLEEEKVFDIPSWINECSGESQ